MYVIGCIQCHLFVLSLMSTARERLNHIFEPTAFFEDRDSNVRNHNFVKILLVRVFWANLCSVSVLSNHFLKFVFFRILLDIKTITW